jgi:prepilin-type N-terminal cleavage/methylation domain-containing protein
MTTRTGSPPGRDSRGFTLIELMVVVVIISLASAIAVPVYSDALTRTRRSSFTADTLKLYNALMAYHADHGAFPDEAAFDLETLAPLSTEGYIRNPEAYTGKLAGGQLLVYVAPDIGGANQHVIAVGRLASDTDFLAAVAYTNLVSDDGEWVDGVYIINQDDLNEARLN